MAKKLVFQKWIAESRKLDEQTERTFVKEVHYIYNLFSKMMNLFILSRLLMVQPAYFINTSDSNWYF